MPRKRRKAVNTETTPDIPFQKVRVEWVDCVSDSGWANEKEFDKMKLSFPVNEGWLYEKTDKHIIESLLSQLSMISVFLSVSWCLSAFVVEIIFPICDLTH